MPQININKFNSGISDDPRQNTTSGFVVSKHFDIFSNPNKLTPYRSTEADTSTSVSSTDLKQYDVRDFLFGKDGKLYGLGKAAASSVPKIFSKADPTTGNWTVEATAQGTGALIRGSFIEWATTTALWMFSGTTNVSKWVIGSTFTNIVGTVGTITTVAQSVIAADNNMYMFYNNKVVRVTPGETITDAVLTLPATMRIMSACNYGGYLAIACAYGTSATAIPSGGSKLFLWDLITADVSDVVDLGDGAVQVIGNVEGRIVAVSDKYMSNAIGLATGSMVVRMWSGGQAKVYKEIKATATVTAGKFLQTVVIKDNKMYWIASVPFNGTTENIGIWAFGRKDVNSDFALTIDYVEEAAGTTVNGFGNAGNYWFITHSGDGSITKTDDAATFTFTSIYESQIFLTSKQNKKLSGVWVTYEALPAAGVVVLKYRKNEETAYTQIFSDGVDNAVSHESVVIESSGASLPEFREIQFRIESTGNAVITGFGFNYEPLIGLTK